MKKAMLTISFGTSNNATRVKTIDAIEGALRDAFPTYEHRRAFASQTIIRKLKTRDGVVVDGIVDALERLRYDGFTHVVVQPTYVISGFE
ncbi:MAG: sirohydrochlorin cobaltochelatase, partial [Oscillospiraceae bacterium]|nr:sirohydrochlorin cobaltochelatase [Oscillospiraceae bacterium]